MLEIAAFSEDTRTLKCVNTVDFLGSALPLQLSSSFFVPSTSSC